MSLEGSEQQHIRNNLQQPKFQQVKSIAMYNQLFYWTTGSAVLCEEYHREEKKYYHNKYTFDADETPFISLSILHSDIQPWPVPVNPVEGVQAIFHEKHANISWRKPRLLGDKGAWQNWLYEITIKEFTSGTSIVIKNITTLMFVVDGLQPATVYSIKVRAYSHGGAGPWSTEFKGKTMKQEPEGFSPYILWSAKEGLLKSNIMGNDVQPLIHKIHLKGSTVTGISWYKERVFLTTNNSQLFTYSISPHQSSLQPINVTNAVSLSVDWLAPKLYWSNPAQNLIYRANLDGSQPEQLKLLTMAKYLAVDSVKGRLYWATQNSIECSYLNGFDKQIYFQVGFFSGKTIMGITLNFDSNKVYWMVRCYDGSMLYSASLLTEEKIYNLNTVTFVGKLLEDEIKGPLHYFSNRLFWVQEENQALLSDTEGQNVARMSGLGLYGIQSLAVVHQSLQPYPDEINSKNINVIPEVIPENDILLTGKWDNFTISWPSSKRVNYGQVFYKVKIDDGLEPYVLYTKKPYVSSASMRTLPAYSSIRVAIRPFTYWSYSHQTLSNLHTPMSVPSAPRHPRVFVTHHSNPFDDRRSIEIEFRWDPPEKSNGIVQIYTICIQHLTPCIQVPGNQLYFNTTPLNPNDTCFFKLSARTTAGEGPMSEIIQYTKSEETPVPQLLLAGENSIKLMDVDNRKEVHLSNKVSQPVDVAYLGLDNSIYWIEENGSLMMTAIHQNKTSLVYKLPQQSNNIAIDWLGRCIYWSENRHLQSTIWRMFLFPEQSPEPVINSTSMIGAIEVNPFSRTLIYTTLNGTGNWEIMTSDTDGSHHCLFFFQDKQVGNNSENMLSSKQCNCHQYPLIEKSIVLDHTVSGDSQLLWIDSHYGHIWSADMHGCLCNLIINASVSEYIGLPPTLITADRNSIYWYNASLEQLFVASKTAVRKEWVSSLTQEPKKFMMTFNPELEILSKQAVGIQSIKAVGHHLQPFPVPSCLIPKHYDKVAELMEVSSMSITVKLLPVNVITSCKNVSQPPLLYTVYYGRTGDSKMSGCYKNFGQCYKLESYNRSVVLSSLDPFTNYSIRVAVSNHYSRALLISTSHVVYQTTEGAPTPPVNVTAEAITPTNIQVTWSQPVHLNGPSVWYEVRKQKIVDQHFGPLDLSHHHYTTLDHEYFTILTSVKPATTYKIVVRAYSSTEAFHSDSLPVKVTTLSFPNNLTLVNIESRSLTVQWISSVASSVVQHRLKYTEERGSMWHTLKVDETEASATYNYTLEKLFPKTKYNFKLELVYRSKINKTFVWLEMPEVQYETLADRPDIPDPPYVKKIGWETYQVSWNEVPSNGGTFLMYELQYRSVINNLTEETEWQTVYYNSTIHWIIQDLPAGISYYFRVRAMNNLGYGSFSHESEQFDLPTPEGLVDSGSHHITTVLASTLSVVFLIVIFLLVAVYMVHHCREQEKKILQEASTDFQNRDLQLSTLQEFPHPGSFVHQNNALYALEDVPIDEELASVPQICREQIVLTKFLGSGAFGEVFEGVAYDLEGESSPPTKVAIKTLRKGATNHEKTEFMKEAKLMSNFKHDHILSLLGVCLDNNPNFIILELMEGGDLLSYLRSSRNASVFGLQPLTLDDLLNICADVAKGCVYLEEMHFVHRDIAARNCLVSSHDPAIRHVKIGDFGLARDIYKNDYYRKEGEGLLPVRWMAPESLIDGVFTSQSDIWAFGVLLWEVMTLGQQPYPARTNLEVLYYVRGGGRLDSPEKCPRELYELMLLCWGYDQESRPSFTTCLETLLALQLKFQNSVVHNHNYIGIHRNNQKHSPERGNSCDIHNIKECGNFSTCSDPTLTKRLNNDLLVHQTVKRAASLTNQPCSCKKDHIMSSPHGLLIGSLPEQSRYLQLLDDNISITDQDGYEIPRFQSSYQPILLNYADLARWNSISSHYSEDISSPTTKANSNEDNIKPSSLGSYSPPPAYLQVFPQLQKSDNVYPHCQNEEKNVETNSAQSDGSCPSEFSATPSYLRRKCLKLNKQQKQSCESDNTSEDYDEGLGESVKTTQSECQTVVTTSDQLDCRENDQWSVLSCSTASLHTWSYPKSQSSSGLSILSEIEAERSLKLFSEALKTDSVGELIL
ncbi:proto-oncogene tyrosine-protein kinase ROS-like [Tachypleus tridentatus]|uniref:proto-oncogene tyrosine-protein kinase ROS-like n=1 Tax=Tachypleus tridentatus TaxID=6853 RepID=UPI003FCFB81C